MGWMEIGKNKLGAMALSVLFVLALLLPVAAQAAEADMALEEVDVIEAQEEGGATQAETTPLIVVDAGHFWGKDGRDSGAVAPDGTREDDLAQIMTKLVVQRLLDGGVRVMTTFPVVDGVESIRPAGAITPLQRAAASNSVEPDLFISIHYNSFTASDPRGAVVLYDSKQLNFFGNATAEWCCGRL